MRIAIVHYWLLNMRGGEKVVEALCRMYPDADIFTLFYDADRVSPAIRSHTVRTSFLQPFRRNYRALLPLMPLALESLDLRGYDLVISSESGPAKGVLLSSQTRHVCYCHTPMRYLWELYPAYRNDWTRPGWRRMAMTPLANYLRLWDYASSARVDEFLANSENVRRRIFKTYRRTATVIHPPVPVETFYSRRSEDYYLIVSELVAYKQIDLAIRTFARNGRKLRIVGEGPEFHALHRSAPHNVEFCGRISDDELREQYARCFALIIPGEEDFGMTAVEALASGKPVIALGRGGVRETVPVTWPEGGVFFPEATEEHLQDAILQLDRICGDIQPEALQACAARFGYEEFERKMRAVLFENAELMPEQEYRAVVGSC